MHGNSMYPTLKPNQDILVWCWFYTPKLGDIVAVKVAGKEMIKRMQMSSDRGAFVLGDNEKESTDSRNFGWIKKDQIIGKVIYIVRMK